VEVHSVTVDCTVTSCFAHTVMTSKAFNKASSSQEIFFEVELPKTAFITNFSEIEGQVYVGEVKDKEKAKKQYEKAVSSGQTAGLVASGRKMEKFSVSVNIAAESNVTFVLTYEELLQRKLGRYELLTRVKPKTLVQDFQIVTNIYEPQGISYIDAHATFLSNELLPLVEKTVTDRKAHISFSPTMEQQRKCPGCDGTLIDGDFIVSYDVKREKNLGDIQIVNGYFVHFFAPELPKLPKNVVFVIDISGSMSGRKMEQTREAMLAILQQVHEDDHFAIILFDSVIETWKDSLTKATKENITEGFYDEVASPLLLEVDMHYPDNAVDSLTTSHFSYLFNGTEIVVAGHLIDDNLDNFLVEVVGQGLEEDFRVQGQVSAADWDVFYPDEEYIFGDFTERLWAYLTIQQLLDKKSGTPDEKANTTAKALDMSLQYSFVTPLTSMVVTKPETEDSTSSPLIADKLTEQQNVFSAIGGIMSLFCLGFGNDVDYSFLDVMCRQNKGVARRIFEGSDAAIQLKDGDPHFMIELPDKNDALCFNINDKPGTIFSLVRDGFVVNGQIISKKKVALDGNVNTYFGRFGITHQNLGVRLDVSIQDISVLYNDKQVKLLWSDATSLRDAMELNLVKNCSLTVTLRHSVKFRVIRHTKVWKRRHDHQDYLGFYTLDSQHLSASVHGLLQFYRGVVFELTDLHPGEGQEKLDATMYVKGQRLNVTHWQKDFNKDVKNGESIACWFVDNEGRGLIDGTASDYTVSDLF
uniref:Inter-alpha-trypsin inhibitor heavy chain H3 n=1 Tax=Maylandia zebra TaxID=106582 RepID=A0A3P9BYI0_9CICH